MELVQMSMTLILHSYNRKQLLFIAQIHLSATNNNKWLFIMFKLAKILILTSKLSFPGQKSKINFPSFALKSRLKIRRECGYFNEFQFRSLKFNLREKFNDFLISSFIKKK